MPVARERQDGIALQRAIRVEDYLNDKLQTIADLSSIDALLADAKAQQSLLEAQLVEARQAHQNAQDASQSFDKTLQQRAHQFQQKQADLDRRLKVMSRSETSDEASAKFQSSIADLQKLEVAQEYIGLLVEVERLTNEAQSNFTKAPQDALKPYLQLKELVDKLRQAQPAAEDAAPHLVHHVEVMAQVLWKKMKASFAGDLEKTLKEMKWPTKDVAFEGSLRSRWEEGVIRLLELQEPELKAREDTAEPVVLLPLEVMVKPLELRFKYHFEGNRPTNKIDKPEYFLSHMTNLLNTYDEFFAIYFQPLLRQHFKGRSLALTTTNIDSTSALITALLPMLRNKVFSVVTQIAKQPHLLSHLVHELMLFDDSLRNDWFYDGGDSVNGWRGLTWDLLVGKSWFTSWLTAEKEFALARYETIISNPEAFEIDRDSDLGSSTKPTYAAIRVNDLLEAVTNRYRPLREFSQKLQFLIDIQIAIFDMFHNRLRESLSAYQSLTSSIGRNLQGASPEVQRDLEGVGGVERLCRILGSAEYLEKKMQDWSDDVFFIELWDELQYRVKRHGDGFAGSMTKEHVAERTSSSIDSNDSGALFDETSSAYERLRIKTEQVLQERLTTGIRDSIRPYGRINPWSSLVASEPNTSLALTAELDATVQYVDKNLGHLREILSQACLRRIIRQISEGLQTFLWNKVVMRYIFSTSGVAQFKRDVETIWGSIGKHSRGWRAEQDMKRLKDAITLLSLPVEADDEDAPDEGPGFWEVERRVFESNESAREVLEELGIDSLTGTDARDVLSRKLERSSA